MGHRSGWEGGGGGAQREWFIFLQTPLESSVVVLVGIIIGFASAVARRLEREEYYVEGNSPRIGLGYLGPLVGRVVIGDSCGQ